MPTDNYGAQADTISSSALNPFAVTPNDSVDLTIIPKALYVGGGGTVVLRGVNSGADTTFTNVAAGSTLMVRPRRVLATGTTATGIIALA